MRIHVSMCTYLQIILKSFDNVSVQYQIRIPMIMCMTIEGIWCVMPENALYLITFVYQSNVYMHHKPFLLVKETSICMFVHLLIHSKFSERRGKLSVILEEKKQGLRPFPHASWSNRSCLDLHLDVKLCHATFGYSSFLQGLNIQRINEQTFFLIYLYVHRYRDRLSNKLLSNANSITFEINRINIWVDHQ
jgi:hypothetical protein